jgi:hypothetical protein
MREKTIDLTNGSISCFQWCLSMRLLYKVKLVMKHAGLFDLAFKGFNSSKGYSCAYIKSLSLLHGIMFLTSNFICFYSKILAHETILIFKWQHITTIIKTNYALLFPTAIRIDTIKSDVKY